MAKKKKEEKEEYEFKEPEFDVKEFIEKEVMDTKATLITMGYGLVFVLVSYLLLTYSHDWVLAFLAGLIGMFTTRSILPRTGIDIKKFEKKTWLGLIGTYFFTWLAVFVLVCNPPISDFIEPTIGEIEIYAGSVKLNDTKNVTSVFGNTSLTVGKEIKIVAKVADNYKLKSVDYVVLYPNDTVAGSGFMENDGNNFYTFTYNFTVPYPPYNNAGYYTIKIMASDTYGHVSTKEIETAVYP